MQMARAAWAEGVGAVLGQGVWEEETLEGVWVFIRQTTLSAGDLGTVPPFSSLQKPGETQLWGPWPAWP